MDPKALIMDGKIDAARAMLVDQIKKSPADVQARALLFQVLLLCGEWDKARRQLDIAATQQASPDMNVPVYQNLIQRKKSVYRWPGWNSDLPFFPIFPNTARTFFRRLSC
jgi:protein involved in temperature-dependent protein secretion